MQALYLSVGFVTSGDWREVTRRSGWFSLAVFLWGGADQVVEIMGWLKIMDTSFNSAQFTDVM